MQVYCDNRLVGNLNWALPDGARHFELEFFDKEADLFVEDGFFFPTAVSVRKSFEIKQRGVAVPIDDWRGNAGEILEVAKKSYRIPDDADCEPHNDPMRPGLVYRFRWPALDLSTDDYEQLFDHPAFEPC